MVTKAPLRQIQWLKMLHLSPASTDDRELGAPDVCQPLCASSKVWALFPLTIKPQVSPCFKKCDGLFL